MHRLLALRACLRGSAGHLRADHFRPRLRQPGVAGDEREFPRFRMRFLRRLRAGLPDRDADRKVCHRDRPARALGGDHLRLLRRRLHLQGGDARRGSGADGAVQGRQGQSRPFLRQGPLRLGLHQPQGAHPQPDDPRQDQRALARSVVGRGVFVRRREAQGHPGQVRPRLGRRHHVVALHQRRNLSGAEADPRRFRQQQCRYLRTGLPFADRLWPCHHLRHLGRNAGFRLRRAHRRDHDHRRQPDRCAPGVRLAHEEAVARGRQS